MLPVYFLKVEGVIKRLLCILLHVQDVLCWEVKLLKVLVNLVLLLLAQVKGISTKWSAYVSLFLWFTSHKIQNYSKKKKKFLVFKGPVHLFLWASAIKFWFGDKGQSAEGKVVRRQLIKYLPVSICLFPLEFLYLYCFMFLIVSSVISCSSILTSFLVGC